MLQVFSKIGRGIQKVERKDHRLFLYSEAFSYRLEPKTDGILRITVTKKGEFEINETPGIICREVQSSWDYEETPENVVMRLPKLILSVDRKTGAFTYYDKDEKLLLREDPKDSKTLEEFMTYRMMDGGVLEKEEIRTADGKKQVIKAADRVENGMRYHTRMKLIWQEQERLYGLGQQEEGICNLRGRTVYVHQANRKIAIPMLVSDHGYGMLINTYSPMIFSDNEYGSYIYTEADKEMDYFFIQGENVREVIKGYRFLTGKATLLPKWAFGYLQSQERYETQEEILDVAAKYREKGLGLDGIILDWCSWEDGMWGQKSLDETRFPDARSMTDQLHETAVHFMISIWPNMDEHCENYKEFKEKKLLLPGSNVYNPFDEAGRELYWQQVERALFSKGIDSWWCDSSEPFTPEWNHMVRQEPSKMYEEFVREAENYMPAELTNAFALYHARALYEGQRASKNPEGKQKRVFNLTRSAYTGQQRYGTVMWSGDIGASWDTYKRQIREGLSFSASGMPYWTTDIGAFFVKTGEQWYWDGEYPETTEDMGYRELFVRWYQWESFLPIFRGHGTDCRRELWKFGNEGDLFYDALVKANRRRYELMPYIYSLAGRVWLEDESFIQMLPLAYPEDETAKEITDQFLLGDELMICPVTEPMYYEAGSIPCEGIKKLRKVYLPKGSGWYSYEKGNYYEGGQWITVPAAIDEIPVFVREGSILPTAEFTGSVADIKEITLRIYAGDGKGFKLYEDAGDGYGYEQGDYSVRELIYEEATDRLSIKQLFGDAHADYITNIKTQIVFHKEENNSEKASI